MVYRKGLPFFPPQPPLEQQVLARPGSGVEAWNKELQKNIFECLGSVLISIVESQSLLFSAMKTSEGLWILNRLGLLE